jgi:Spy/CpxP family protein refolding chaperone
MKPKTAVILTMTTALVLAASLAAAEMVKGSESGGIPPSVTQRGDEGGGGMGSAALPPEKREAIRRIQSDYAERLFRLRQDVRSKQAELNAIMLKPQPDTVKAKSTVRDIARLQTQEADTLIDMHARISLETDVRLPMLPAGPGAVQMKKE